MTFSPHIQMAIDFEQKLIERSKKQIEGYKKRIDLMTKGHSYGDTQKEVLGIPFIEFDWEKYYRLKKEYKKELEK